MKTLSTLVLALLLSSTAVNAKHTTAQVAPSIEDNDTTIMYCRPRCKPDFKES